MLFPQLPIVATVPRFRAENTEKFQPEPTCECGCRRGTVVGRCDAALRCKNRSAVCQTYFVPNKGRQQRHQRCEDVKSGKCEPTCCVLRRKNTPTAEKMDVIDTRKIQFGWIFYWKIDIRKIHCLKILSILSIKYFLHIFSIYSQYFW